MSEGLKRWYPVISSGIAVMFIMLLSGCAAQKLKRAERLIKKAEEMGAQWHTQTVYVKDTVIVTETHLDSIFVPKVGDTVVLTKDRLTVKYVRLRGDTVFVAGECAADTVIKKVPVTVIKTITAKGGIKWWWILIALAVGTIFGRLFFKVLLG